MLEKDDAILENFMPEVKTHPGSFFVKPHLQLEIFVPDFLFNAKSNFSKVSQVESEGNSSLLHQPWDLILGPRMFRSDVEQGRNHHGFYHSRRSGVVEDRR